MSFDYSMPNLPEIPQILPQGMMQLANTLPDVKVSIPTVDKVLEAIEQGKPDQVSQLEWIYCISANRKFFDCFCRFEWIHDYHFRDKKRKCRKDDQGKRYFNRQSF